MTTFYRLNIAKVTKALKGFYTTFVATDGVQQESTE